jgi:hypothetical protein
MGRPAPTPFVHDRSDGVGGISSQPRRNKTKARARPAIFRNGREDVSLSFFPRERTREAFVSMYVYLAQKILNICIDQKQKAGGRRTAGLNSGARHHHAATLAGGTPAHSSIQLAQKPAIFSRSRPSIHILLGDSLHCTEPPLYQSYFLSQQPCLFISLSVPPAATAAVLVCGASVKKKLSGRGGESRPHRS